MTPRERIAARIAQELHDGDVVNLGIGMPVLVANFIPEGIHIQLHTENGMIGAGPAAQAGQEDWEITSAGAEAMTVLPGGSFFDSALSFAIARGGHVDVAVLGAFQVDEQGNLASWAVPGGKVTGMGGAMDLVVGSRRVIVAMEHVTRQGEPRILHHCTYPLTAQGQVDMIVTDRAVISVTPEGLLLREIMPGWTLEEVLASTEANLLLPEEGVKRLA